MDAAPDIATEAVSPTLHSAPTIPIDPQPRAAPEQWAAGDAIEGRYTVLEVRGGRGSSGMGSVYLVRDECPDAEPRHYAIKTLQRRHAQTLDHVRRFLREAETWVRLGCHPNIVHAYRVEIIDAVPCLFMDLVPSDEAGRHHLGQHIAQGPIAPAQVLRWAAQWCDGMNHAAGLFPGLVHRDLKPENVLVSPSGTLKITDFGLVRALEPDAPETDAGPAGNGLDERLTAAGAIMGTPAYMAPEQFQQACCVGVEADVYAFGCCLYEMIGGRPPFLVKTGSTAERVAGLRRLHLEAAPPPLRARAPDCPAALMAIVERCLAKAPEDRFADFHAVRAALCACAAGLGIGIDPPRPPNRPNAREAAGQAQSQRLLRGYRRAIELRNLRERRAEDPYAFHLALASYFACHGDAAESERQLRRALRVRSAASGYEALRRLAELCIAQERLDAADALLGRFLDEHPCALDDVLEPLVRLKCLLGRAREARLLLDGRGDGPRVRALHAEIARAEGDMGAWTAIMASLAAQDLDGIERLASQASRGEAAGWARADDPERLAQTMALLRPGCALDELMAAPVSLPPSLCGYPNMGPAMAALSDRLGALARDGAGLEPAALARYREGAALLDYPRRGIEQREYDECWLWRQTAPGG